MPKSRSTRKATGRTSAPARKLTLPILTLACGHDAYKLCRHCAPDMRKRAELRRRFANLTPAEREHTIGQRRIILPDQTLTTDGKPLPRNALDYERPGKPPIVAGPRKTAKRIERCGHKEYDSDCDYCRKVAGHPPAKETNSIASDVRLLYAAARKLTPHAPPNDGDIPYATLVRECPHLPGLLERLGYDPQQGYIPADLRGIAEFLQMPKNEPSEAQCALRLLELGFEIVRKGTTKKATRAELERAIARERPTSKKGD